MERRHTKKVVGGVSVYPVAAAALIETGNAVGLIGGYLAPVDASEPDQVMVGLARATVDNTDGAAGALTCEVEEGCFLFRNSAASDAVARTNIATPCFAIDGGTVSSTSDTTEQPPMGIVGNVTALGVEVHVGPLASATARAFLVAAAAEPATP